MHSASRSKLLLNMLSQAFIADVLDILTKSNAGILNSVDIHTCLNLISQGPFEVQACLDRCPLVRNRILFPYRPIGKVLWSVLPKKLLFMCKGFLFSDILSLFPFDNLLTSIPNLSNND